MKNTLKIAVLMSMFAPMAVMAIPAPFATYTFDENGTWSWSGPGGGSGQVTGQIAGGGIQYDTSVTTYPFNSALIGQTYGYCEQLTSWDMANLSDVIHIDDASHFSYYSDPGDTDLADLTSGSLTNLIQSNGWSIPTSNQRSELGPEGNNYVEFMQMITGGYINFHGISDVPEPSTFSLLALSAFAGVRLLWRRRS